MCGRSRAGAYGLARSVARLRPARNGRCRCPSALGRASRALGGAVLSASPMRPGRQRPCDTRSLAEAYREGNLSGTGRTLPASGPGDCAPGPGVARLTARAPPVPLAPCGGRWPSSGLSRWARGRAGTGPVAPFLRHGGPLWALGRARPRRLIAFPPVARRGCRPLLGVPWSVAAGIRSGCGLPVRSPLLRCAIRWSPSCARARRNPAGPPGAPLRGASASVVAGLFSAAGPRSRGALWAALRPPITRRAPGTAPNRFRDHRWLLPANPPPWRPRWGLSGSAWLISSAGRKSRPFARPPGPIPIGRGRR